jgi:hypothetical protein
MNLELLSAIAAVGTFLVIAATAFAAIVQLRHLRSSNQIAAINDFRQVVESPGFRAARRFIQYDLPRLMNEPNFAERIEKRALDGDLETLNVVGNLFESLGVFCKYRIIDKEVVCDLFSGPVLTSWRALAPVIASRRRSLDAPALLENYEYLVMLCEDFEARHPDGAYPRGARRLQIDDFQARLPGKPEGQG